MLAREIIEDSLLSFLTKESPDYEIDGEEVSRKVINYGYLFFFSFSFVKLLPEFHIQFILFSRFCPR